MNGIFGDCFPLSKVPRLSCWSGAHMRGPGGGGRLPHRAGSRGGSPLPPEASSQAFRAGISRMGQPLAAGGYPIPSRFLPLCMAALAPGAASRLRLAPRRAVAQSRREKADQRYRILWLSAKTGTSFRVVSIERRRGPKAFSGAVWMAAPEIGTAAGEAQGLPVCPGWGHPFC